MKQNRKSTFLLALGISGLLLPLAALADSSNSNGGQKLCVSSRGSFVTRGKCKRSETRVTATNLPTIADISLAGIPVGSTVTGVIGGEFDTSNTSSSWSVDAALPIKLSTALATDDVIVAATAELLSACSNNASNCLSAAEVAVASACTGTIVAPTAPAGKLCIYPFTVTNASSIAGIPIPSTSATFGAKVTWNATNIGHTAFGATWAYTR